MIRSHGKAFHCYAGFWGRSNFGALLVAASGISVMFGCGTSSPSSEPSADRSSAGASVGGSAGSISGAPAGGGSNVVAGGGNAAIDHTGGTGGSSPGGAGQGSVGRGGSGGALAEGGSIGTAGNAATGGNSASGGPGGTYVGTKNPGNAQAGDVTVDPTKTHQVVDGFGEADVWQGSSSTAMQTLLWDPVNGIGLNLLRVGIDGTSGTANIMGAAGYADGQACVKFNGNDCKVWAAPWSPPASMKDNNNVNNGGHLSSSNYAAWAKILAAFPAFYKSKGGVDLYAISAQNEPDFVASYQSAIFNSSQMVAWIGVLGPVLAALTPPCLLYTSPSPRD